MSTLHKLTKGLLNRHRVQRQLDAEQKASQRLRQRGSSPTGAGTSSSSPSKLKSALAAGKRDAAAMPKKTLSFALPTHEDPGAGAGGDELDDAAKAEAAELKALRREALDKLRMEQRRQREAKRAEKDAGAVDLPLLRRQASKAKLLAARGGSEPATSVAALLEQHGAGVTDKVDVEAVVEAHLENSDPWDPQTQLSPRSRLRWRQEMQAMVAQTNPDAVADDTDLAAIVRGEALSRTKHRPVSLPTIAAIKYKLSRRRKAKAKAKAEAKADGSSQQEQSKATIAEDGVPGVVETGLGGAASASDGEADLVDRLEAGDEGPYAVGWDNETAIAGTTGNVSWLHDNELVDLAGFGEWVAPDLEELSDVHARRTFARGAAPMTSYSYTRCARKRGAVRLTKLGEGVLLYFNFLQMTACALLVMSLISIPVLDMCLSGSGIHPDDMDPLYLAATTIGNSTSLQSVALNDVLAWLQPPMLLGCFPQLAMQAPGLCAGTRPTWMWVFLRTCPK